MGYTITLKVRLRAVGFHHWKDAPKVRDYLAQKHRHVFHFQVESKVESTDREVEFHELLEMVKGSISGLFKTEPLSPFDFNFGSFSCEDIAVEILHCSDIFSAVEVWEDGECGARVERGLD